MVSLEEKFDQLILAVTGPLGPSERLGTVTSIGPYAQRNTNPGGGFPDFGDEDSSRGVSTGDDISRGDRQNVEEEDNKNNS